MGDKNQSELDVCSACQSIRPATPPPEACCGSGCSLCVFDIHDQEVGLWRRNCLRKHYGDATAIEEEDAGQIAMDPLEYRHYFLESIKPVCVNTAIYRFTLPAGTRLDLAIAKHIILRGTLNNRTITRQYTPISPPHAHGYFDVLIKLYENGEMSRYIRRWRVGHKIEWRGTFGSFTHQPNKVRRILMLGAGTGITPLIQVIRHIMDNEDDETVIRLVYSCHTYPEVLLRDELNELALYWNVSIVYHLSQDLQDSHSIEYGETVHYGRITMETISQEVQTAGSLLSVRALVCGTRSFEEDMVTCLKDAGLEEASITKF